MESPYNEEQNRSLITDPHSFAKFTANKKASALLNEQIQNYEAPNIDIVIGGIFYILNTESYSKRNQIESWKEENWDSISAAIFAPYLKKNQSRKYHFMNTTILYIAWFASDSLINSEWGAIFNK